MNELERMIAGIHRPGPSADLDERVQRLLIGNDSIRPARSFWRGAVALLTTAACVGAICFYWGRQSVLGTADPPGVTIQAVASDPPPQSRLAAGTVVRIPLPEDQVAALFMHGLQREGLLGAGPVTVDVSSAP